MNRSFYITPFKETDYETVRVLVNSAYRGEVSKQGWTTEAGIIDGDTRIDEQALRTMLMEPGASILCCRENDQVIGSVYLKNSGAGLYLGMFAVAPHLQGLGIGKLLLQAAEEYAKEQERKFIVMTVIDIRQELIEWYERHGYVKTGETEPFPTDQHFGKPLMPLKFAVLKKLL